MVQGRLRPQQDERVTALSYWPLNVDEGYRQVFMGWARVMYQAGRLVRIQKVYTYPHVM